MSEAPVFAHVLHREVALRLAGSKVYERGLGYFREKRVVNLTRRGGELSGVVRGTASYRVKIWVNGDGLGYTCSCPFAQEGAFCKHAVALSLAWLGPREEDAAVRSDLAELERALASLPAAALCEVLLALVRDEPALAARVNAALAARRS